jgi:copper transport protein
MKRFGICFLLTVLMLCLGSVQAYAHANLLSTTPQNGQVVATTPETVTLDFGEDLQAGLIDLKVYDWNARPIGIQGPFLTPGKPSEMFARLPKLQTGTYTVAWSVVSQDGHPVNGSFLFSVGHVTTGSTITVDSSKDAFNRLLVGIRYGVEGLLLISSGLYGISFFATRRNSPGVIRWKPYAKWVWISLFLGLLLEWWTYAATLPGTSLTIDLVKGNLERILQTRFAVVLLIQMLLLVLLAIPNMQEIWYLGVFVLLTAAFGFEGHGWGAHPVWLAIGLRVLHLLAMAVWLGALTYLMGLLRWQMKQHQSMDWGSFRPFFVRTVACAVVMLFLTGMGMFLMQTDVNTVLQNGKTWAVLLGWKLVLFAAMLGLAGFQTVRWKREWTLLSMPLLRIEWFLGCVVILFGVWMSQSPYPVPAKSYVKTLESDSVQADVQISRLMLGKQTMKIHLHDPQHAQPQSLSVYIDMNNMNMELEPIPAKKTGVDTYEANVPFPMSGYWKFVVDAEYQPGQHRQWSDTVFIPSGN